MTLILAAHNDKSIIIGTDTMIIEIDTKTGENTTAHDGRKIFPLGPQGTLLLSGNFNSSKVVRFLKYFMRTHKDTFDIEVIYKDFCNKAHLTLGFRGTDSIEVIMAGFNAIKVPKIYCVRVDARDSFDVRPESSYYEATGYAEPSSYALHKFKDTNISSKTSLFKLRRVAKNIIKECIKNHPQLVNGDPVIITLRKKSRIYTRAELTSAISRLMQNVGMFK